MPERSQIHKCSKCGNIIEILHGGSGTLTCCGSSMEQMKEGSVDASQEKHVPVIERKKDGYLVKVGSVSHPMEEKHYIEWIELIADNKVYRQYLNPDETPEAFFPVDAETVTAREYCNLHGLWKAGIGD